MNSTFLADAGEATSETNRNAIRFTTCKRESSTASSSLTSQPPLPEGSRWKLVPLDSLQEAMDPKEHAEFFRELEISAKEAAAGELIDAEDVLAKLRAPA